MTHTTQHIQDCKQVRRESVPVDIEKKQKILLWLAVSALRQKRPALDEGDFVMVSSQPSVPSGHRVRQARLCK